MTKRDLNSLMIASAYGAGGFLLFWLFFRPKMQVREISPAAVQWEGQ